LTDHWCSLVLANTYNLLFKLMPPGDHFVFRFLYFTTAGVKCCVAAVKSCPVLHFSIVIFFWSLGIIDANIFHCWELSTAQAGARERKGCCTYSSIVMYILNQTESAILVIVLWFMLRGITFFPDFQIISTYVIL
jgi:hypothetical protein